MAPSPFVAFLSCALFFLASISLLFAMGLLDSRRFLPHHHSPGQSRRHGHGIVGNTTGQKQPNKPVESDAFIEILQSSDEFNGSNVVKSLPDVLILTPLKQAAGHLERYFNLIYKLTYPSSKISLGFLVSDSSDGTYNLVKEHFLSSIQNLEKGRRYKRTTLIKQDFDSTLGRSWGEIHSLRNQQIRRSVLAKSRNYLLISTLRPEHDWVLWIDSDVSFYPSTLIEDLLSFTGPEKHIIAPNNFWKSNDGKELPYDRNNWQETPASRKFLKETKEVVLFEGYSNYKTGRLILGDLRGTRENIVKLDGVGGTVLLIRARLHREGLVFLPVPFEKAIETEALAKLALTMGYQPWGLPNYITLH